MAGLILRKEEFFPSATQAVAVADRYPQNVFAEHTHEFCELVLVWLEVKASQNVPDALVVDLLPAGLELENQNLASSSASLQDSGSEVQNLLSQMQQADIQHMEFRDDRFVAAVPVNEGQPVTLVYLARAVTPGTYQVPVPMVESMYVPQWRATGAASGPLIVVP